MSILSRIAQTGPAKGLRARMADGVIRRLALTALIERTDNFDRVTWLGRPIWQNVTDAWLIQEAIVHDNVDFDVECDTNRGGSGFYMASILVLMGRGSVMIIDVDKRAGFEQPRIEFLRGSST